MTEEVSKDVKVEQSSFEVDIKSPIRHNVAETTADGTYVLDTKLQDGNIDESSSEVKEIRTTKDG
jgi:hypothetical protein